MRNSKKLILTILLPFLCAVSALSQTVVKVSGVVTSADDGLPDRWFGIQITPI